MMVDYIFPKEAIFYLKCWNQLKLFHIPLRNETYWVFYWESFLWQTKLNLPQTYSDLWETSYTHLHEIVEV